MVGVDIDTSLVVNARDALARRTRTLQDRLRVLRRKHEGEGARDENAGASGEKKEMGPSAGSEEIHPREMAEKGATATVDLGLSAEEEAEASRLFDSLRALGNVRFENGDLVRFF